jgi:hypothetical protein
MLPRFLASCMKLAWQCQILGKDDRRQTRLLFLFLRKALSSNFVFVHADRCFSFKTNGQTYIQDSILSWYIRLCLIWIVLSLQWILKYRCVRLVSLIMMLDLIVLFVFWQNMIFFLCVAYGQYPNMFLTFFIKKTNIWNFKNVFLHGFLKKKKYFLASWILQRVCKFLRVLANIPKI